VIAEESSAVDLTSAVTDSHPRTKLITDDVANRNGGHERLETSTRVAGA